MQRNPLHAAALAAALLVGTATGALAQGTTTAPGTVANPATTTADDVDDDGGLDLGWLGLIGLAGLAGLTGRKRDTRVDVNRPRV